MKWHSVPVEDLVNGLETPDVLGAVGPLGRYLDELPAIYMWKLKVNTAELEEAEDWNALFEEIDKRLQIPFGKINNKLVDRLDLGDSYIRGKAVTNTKKEKLKDNYDFDSTKKHIIGLTKILDSHTPSLYVGQTINLRKRITDHLRGESQNFGGIVSASPQLEFKDMHLYFCYFEELENAEEGDALLTTLEWITTMVTFGGYNRRDG